MYVATGGPNVKWGGTNFKWGPGTTGPVPGGLIPPKQSSKHPKLKHETLLISVVFVNFENV